jgi:hypothetical protein
MRSAHCWSHGRGQAQRLVPGRQLHGAGAGVAGERHREHLQHDALDVVLRLRLGEPERVDLDAVAQAALLRVRHAVASRVISSQSRANARILHISSTKRSPALTKNEMRPTTSPNSAGGTCPESRTESSTAIACSSA